MMIDLHHPFFSHLTPAPEKFWRNSRSGNANQAGQFRNNDEYQPDDHDANA